MQLGAVMLSGVLVAGCRTPQATPAPESTPSPAELEGVRAERAVGELNQLSGDCVILAGASCCLAYAAVRRDVPAPPGRAGYFSDPDCTEGPPGRKPPGPVLCPGQRVPSGVRLAPDGGCELLVE